MSPFWIALFLSFIDSCRRIVLRFRRGRLFQVSIDMEPGPELPTSHQTNGSGHHGEFTPSTTPTRVSPTRNPKCARCRNHGIKVKVKGHKKKCQYATCVCPCCSLIEERRIVMAKQNAAKKGEPPADEGGFAPADYGSEFVFQRDYLVNGGEPASMKVSAFKFTGGKLPFLSLTAFPYMGVSPVLSFPNTSFLNR